MEALFTTVETIEAARGAAERRYVEFLRVPELSAGLYVLEPGSADPQSPHSEDEVYVVVRGRCGFLAGGQQREIGAGAVLFVPARMEHRFLDIRERLEALVFFGPAEGSRG
jgi:mannose-6-phosphate isomerase-like protein (cupin superfamily)